MADETKKLGDQIVIYNMDRRTVRVDVEKRLLKRIPVNKSVFLSDGKKNGEGQFLNLSGGGALLKTDLKLDVDAVISVSVTKKDVPFARAKVLRESNGEYGLKWLELFEDQLPKGWVASEKV